jgi:hypothetical protein
VVLVGGMGGGTSTGQQLAGEGVAGRRQWSVTPPVADCTALCFAAGHWCRPLQSTLAPDLHPKYGLWPSHMRLSMGSIPQPKIYGIQNKNPDIQVHGILKLVIY